MPSSSSWRSDPAGLLLAAALAAALPSCATPGATGEIRTDLDTIQQQLFVIQKENAALLEQVKTLEQARATAPAAEGAAAELRLRLETVERDLRTLQQRTLESEQRLGAVAQEVRATRDAVEALARSLAAAPPQAAPGPAFAAAPGVADPGTGAAIADPAAAAAPALPGGPAAAAGMPPLLDDLYRQGYADYSKGNYALALQELGEFVKRYPSSPLADDAQYLVGEVLYAQEKYPEAVGAFEEVIQRYGSGDKVPAAYLKKGLALLEMNRTADAVIQLQHVVTAYPRTEEARIARERLRGLGLRER